MKFNVPLYIKLLVIFFIIYFVGFNGIQGYYGMFWTGPAIVSNTERLSGKVPTISNGLDIAPPVYTVSNDGNNTIITYSGMWIMECMFASNFINKVYKDQSNEVQNDCFSLLKNNSIKIMVPGAQKLTN